MKYPCLVLDHDDTVVNSTATIHFPSFVEYMKIHRPNISMSLEEYFKLNYDPGVVELFTDICGLSPQEMKEEEQFWSDYVKDHIPEPYPGMREILWRYKEAGGTIAVVSHSYGHYIRRDYEAGGLPEPDLVYGWELEPEKRKPDPFCLLDIQEKLGFTASQLLVLDDLKPGYDMARAAGVTFAAAGWANDVPEIENFMRQNCDFYFKRVGDFGRFLLEETDQKS